MNILIVEDDAVIRKSVVQGLTEAGHECDSAATGTGGLEKVRSSNPDLVILDLMLPGRQGMEVLRELRGEGFLAPIIILTAKESVEDRVAGLKGGADDYLIKPFALAELLARIDAVSRRNHVRPPMVLSAPGITLDLTTRRVRRGDEEVDLTPTEFSILELLLRYAGQVVSRRMLCEHVWGFTWEGNTNVIEVHINRIRQKLDADPGQSVIQTVRGRGYAVRTSA